MHLKVPMGLPPTIKVFIKSLWLYFSETFFTLRLLGYILLFMIDKILTILQNGIEVFHVEENRQNSKQNFS